MRTAANMAISRIGKAAVTKAKETGSCLLGSDNTRPNLKIEIPRYISEVTYGAVGRVSAARNDDISSRMCERFTWRRVMSLAHALVIDINCTQSRSSSIDESFGADFCEGRVTLVCKLNERSEVIFFA